MESRPSNAVVRFGTFELHEQAGELLKDGIRIRLQEQPLQILQILLEHPGKVITREELKKRIWPSDTFVDFDHGINNAIKRLRELPGAVAGERVPARAHAESERALHRREGGRSHRRVRGALAIASSLRQI